MKRTMHGKALCEGFTMIEWTIYFFLVMVVVTGIFQYVAGVRQHLVGLAQQSSALSQLSAAQDACVRDLSAAPNNIDQWHELGPASLAWHSGQTMCCWAVEEGMLVRREKNFDVTKKVWRSAHKSVVARGHVELKAVPLYAPRKIQNKHLIVGIELWLSCVESSKKLTVHKTVTLKNGRV